MGSKAGGKAAYKTNTEREPGFYRRIGQLGGLAKKTRPSGFAAMPRHKVIEAGRKGGLVSKRGALTDEQKRKQSESMKAKWAERKEQAEHLSRKYQ